MPIAQNAEMFVGAACAIKDGTLYLRTPVREAPAEPTYGVVCHPRNETEAERRVFGLALAYPKADEADPRALVAMVARDLEVMHLAAAKDERQVLRACAWVAGRELARVLGGTEPVATAAAPQGVCPESVSPARQMREGALDRGCRLHAAHDAEQAFWTARKVWSASLSSRHEGPKGKGFEDRLVERLASDAQAQTVVHTTCDEVREALSTRHLDADASHRRAVTAALDGMVGIIRAMKA